MFDWIVGARFTNFAGLLLYWLPLSLCAVGYTLRSWRKYRDDLERREAASKSDKAYYAPSETIGTLIGRALATICPICNLWAACFDVGPDLFGRLFERLGKVFDQPLVPPRK